MATCGTTLSGCTMRTRFLPGCPERIQSPVHRACPSVMFAHALPGADTLASACSCACPAVLHGVHPVSGAGAWPAAGPQGRHTIGGGLHGWLHAALNGVVPAGAVPRGMARRLRRSCLSLSTAHTHSIGTQHTGSNVLSTCRDTACRRICVCMRIGTHDRICAWVVCVQGR